MQKKEVATTFNETLTTPTTSCTCFTYCCSFWRLSSADFDINYRHKRYLTEEYKNMAIQNSFNWYCGTAQKSNEAANPNIALSVFALPIVSFVAFGLNRFIS